MSKNYRLVTVTLGGGGTLVASIITDSAMSDQDVRAEVLEAVRSTEISRYISKDAMRDGGVEVSVPEPVSFPETLDVDSPEWVKNGEKFWRY